MRILLLALIAISGAQSKALCMHPEHPWMDMVYSIASTEARISERMLAPSNHDYLCNISRPPAGSSIEKLWLTYAFWARLGVAYGTEEWEMHKKIREYADQLIKEEKTSVESLTEVIRLNRFEFPTELIQFLQDWKLVEEWRLELIAKHGPIVDWKPFLKAGRTEEVWIYVGSIANTWGFKEMWGDRGSLYPYTHRSIFFFEPEAAATDSNLGPDILFSADAEFDETLASQIRTRYQEQDAMLEVFDSFPAFYEAQQCGQGSMAQDVGDLVRHAHDYVKHMRKAQEARLHRVNNYAVQMRELRAGLERLIQHFDAWETWGPGAQAALVSASKDLVSGPAEMEAWLRVIENDSGLAEINTQEGREVLLDFARQITLLYKYYGSLMIDVWGPGGQFFQNLIAYGPMKENFASMRWPLQFALKQVAFDLERLEGSLKNYLANPYVQASDLELQYYFPKAIGIVQQAMAQPDCHYPQEYLWEIDSLLPIYRED